MRIFCKAMHKHAELLPHPDDTDLAVCQACFMVCNASCLTPWQGYFDKAASLDRDVRFREKHDVDKREVMGVDWAKPGSETTVTQIWADTQNELSGKMVRCAPREVGKGLDWNSVMRGFRCIQPNKTRLPFWAPYQNWADLVCPHCSSSVSQGLTSGHHEMDGASPITLAMLRKEVPADDLRFAELRPTRSMVVGVDREALGHVEALLGYFTTQDFVSGSPDKRRALANALAWLNDNK